MCRMMAITTKNIDPRLLFIMLDRGLISALADDKGQIDGYGIATCDGIVTKGKGSYRDADLWFNPSILRTPIIGHLRAASNATGKTDKEAHPYYFDKAAVPFLLQHNGNVSGSFGIAAAPFPMTDSYAAGQELEELVNLYKKLDADVLKEWAKSIKDTNPFVFFILARDSNQKETLYILRGNSERTMYYIRFGDGHIFHTSYASLFNLAAYCIQLGLASFEQQELQEVPAKKLLVVQGDTIVEHDIALAKDERLIIPWNAAWPAAPYGTQQYGVQQYNAQPKQKHDSFQKPAPAYKLFFPLYEEKEEEKETWVKRVMHVLAMFEFAPTATLASYFLCVEEETEKVPGESWREILSIPAAGIADIVRDIKTWNSVVDRKLEYAFLEWIDEKYYQDSDLVLPFYVGFKKDVLEQLYKTFIEEQKATSAANAAGQQQEEKA